MLDISGFVASLLLNDVVVADPIAGRTVPGNCILRGGQVGTIDMRQVEIVWDLENGTIPDNSIHHEEYPFFWYNRNENRLRSPNDHHIEYGNTYFRNGNENRQFLPVQKIGTDIPIVNPLVGDSVTVTTGYYGPTGKQNALKLQGQSTTYPLDNGKIEISNDVLSKVQFDSADIIIVGAWYKPIGENRQIGQQFNTNGFARFEGASDSTLTWRTRTNQVTTNGGNSYFNFTDPKVSTLGNGWTHVRDYVRYETKSQTTSWNIYLLHQNTLNRDAYLYRPYIIKISPSDSLNIHDVVNYVNTLTFQPKSDSFDLQTGDLAVLEDQNFFLGDTAMVEKSLETGGLKILSGGQGLREASDLGLTGSNFVAGFSTTGEIVDVPQSNLQDNLGNHSMTTNLTTNGNAIRTNGGGFTNRLEFPNNDDLQWKHWGSGGHYARLNYDGGNFHFDIEHSTDLGGMRFLRGGSIYQQIQSFNGGGDLKIGSKWNGDDVAAIQFHRSNTAPYVSLGAGAPGNFGTGLVVDADWEVGVGTFTPDTKFQVNGDVKITGTIWLNATKTLGIFTGTGTPEGTISADVGSFFMRTDGGAGTSLYVKESGTGNTGWIAK